MATASSTITWHAKFAAFLRVVTYNPVFTAGLIVFGGGGVVFEGVGSAVIYPILKVGQHGEDVEATDFVMAAVLATYDFLGIPFRLGYLIVGVGVMMTGRYLSTFLAS